MVNRRLPVAIVVLCAGFFGGRHRRAAVPSMVPVPIGLDSVGVARWLADQRKACRGRLVTTYDEGSVHNFDTASVIEYRYRIGLIGVQCLP
jgi:hypothetical protein